MDSPEILADLVGIFREVFEDQSIVLRTDTTADDIPEWDSQSHIGLVLAAEHHFGVRFRTSELDSMRNVGDFVAVILAKLS